MFINIENQKIGFFCLTYNLYKIIFFRSDYFLNFFITIIINSFGKYNNTK